MTNNDWVNNYDDQLPSFVLVVSLVVAVVVSDVRHLETVSGTSNYLLLCEADTLTGGDSSLYHQ